jgi:hypothetical protein
VLLVLNNTMDYFWTGVCSCVCVRERVRVCVLVIYVLTSPELLWRRMRTPFGAENDVLTFICAMQLVLKAVRDITAASPLKPLLFHFEFGRYVPRVET